MAFVSAKDMYKPKQGTIVIEEGQALRTPEGKPKRNWGYGKPKYDIETEVIPVVERLLRDQTQYWTIAGLADYFDVVRDTFYEWMKYNNNLSDTVKRSLAAQEMNLAKRLINGECNTTGAIFALKNSAHAWKDKIEETSTQSIGDVIEATGGVNAVFDPGVPSVNLQASPMVNQLASHQVNQEVQPTASLSQIPETTLPSEFKEDESDIISPEL